MSGNASVFAYETRFVDGEPLETVVIDSKQSQLNRVEQPLSIAIEGGDALLSKVPQIRVSYDGATYTDLDLPHRAFDGHIRAGSLDGKPVTESAAYRAVRDASAANARALIEASPASLVFGAWDASRRSHQGRYRRALVGEIIGVLADQSENARTSPKRGGARVDPVATRVNTRRRYRPVGPTSAPTPPRSRADELPATPSPDRCRVRRATLAPSALAQPSPQSCTDGWLASFPMTVPWAYLHPRFQGQEPPAFPGRFTADGRTFLGIKLISSCPVLQFGIRADGRRWRCSFLAVPTREVAQLRQR